MILIIIGESGSGKTSIQDALAKNHGVRPVKTYTTRKRRDGEPEDAYHFISEEKFLDMADSREFLEYTEYSMRRFYGTGYSDITKAILDDELYAVVLTPQGMRKVFRWYGELKKDGMAEDGRVTSVYVTAPLSVRAIRYINRAGFSFSHSDMAELNQRVERDFGMFDGVRHEVDLAVSNDGNLPVTEVALGIYLAVEEIFQKEV